MSCLPVTSMQAYMITRAAHCVYLSVDRRGDAFFVHFSCLGGCCGWTVVTTISTDVDLEVRRPPPPLEFISARALVFTALSASAGGCVLVDCSTTATGGAAEVRGRWQRQRQSAVEHNWPVESS